MRRLLRRRQVPSPALPPFPPILQQLVMPCRCGYSIHNAIVVSEYSDPVHDLSWPTQALLNHYDTCSSRATTSPEPDRASTAANTSNQGDT